MILDSSFQPCGTQFYSPAYYYEPIYTPPASRSNRTSNIRRYNEEPDYYPRHNSHWGFGGPQLEFDVANFMRPGLSDRRVARNRGGDCDCGRCSSLRGSEPPLGLMQTRNLRFRKLGRHASAGKPSPTEQPAPATSSRPMKTRSSSKKSNTTPILEAEASNPREDAAVLGPSVEEQGNGNNVTAGPVDVVVPEEEPTAANTKDGELLSDDTDIEPDAEPAELNSTEDSKHNFIVETLKSIDGVVETVKNLSAEILTHRDSNKAVPEKQYRYFDEMLTKSLLKLDGISTDGIEDIRIRRKEAIALIDEAINNLDNCTKVDTS